MFGREVSSFLNAGKEISDCVIKKKLTMDEIAVIKALCEVILERLPEITDE